MRRSRASRVIVRIGFVTVLAALASLTAEAQTTSPVGVWDATVLVNKLEVPFTFEITQQSGVLSGAFVDGDLRVRSTSGRFEGGALTLTFPQFGARLDATLAGDHLEGMYDRSTRGVNYPFRADRAKAMPPPKGPVPSIAGEWRIPLAANSTKGESSWRMVIRQNGAKVTAAIMRVDGDTGTLDGSYRDGKFLLSHFAGAGPTVVELTPKPDGSLSLVQDGTLNALALRVTDARARTVPAPTDPTQYTTVIDPKAKFTFRFPDLDGKMVSDADARFQGKVVIVSITGTWCPNCHDEAPFLADLYRRYRSKGLEIVALSFEEPAQLKDLTRVRGFIQHYGITYPFLLAGTPEEAPEKIPQAVNLSTFPATFILGKDGRVRATHAGYASKATGAFYTQEQKQFVGEIDRLLAER